MPDEVRSFMEPRFGADFSQVRVHTGSDAVQMNREVNAQAFAHGHDVYFGAGKAPGKDELTAYELTHVVQQTGKTQVQPEIQKWPLSDNRTEREKIDAALKSKKPGDVKDIKDVNQAKESEKLELIRILAYQGWVGPFDESKIEEVWGSFGDQIPRIANKEIVMWQHCINVGADLDKLQEVKKIRDKFESDVKDKAAEYLKQNKEYVLQEMQSLGVLKICVDGQKIPTQEEQDARLKEIQEVAKTVARAQEQVKQLRQIQVGYQVVSGSTGGEAPLPTAYTVPLYFDPDNPTKGQGDSLTDEDIKNNKGKNWQEVYEKWKAPAGVITKAANLYPSIYAAIQESQPGIFSNPDDQVAKIADEKNPEVARKAIADVLSATQTKIDESIQALPNGKPAYYKLDPIHRQFLAGLPGKSGTDWKGNAFNQWVANKDLEKHKERDYWIDIGLKTAAAAAFIVIEVASAGSATFFIAAGVGLAATGANAAIDWTNYVELARTSKTNVKDDTALVDKKQAIDAEAKALESTAEFIAMCTAVGVKGVSGLKRKEPSKQAVLVPKGPDAINLAAEEARGGHSLERHGSQVSLSELRQRVLGTHPNMPQSRTAMKFTNSDVHKDAVNQAYSHNKKDIEAHFADGGGYKEWTFDHGSPTGVGFTNVGTRGNPNVQAVPVGATTKVTLSFDRDPSALGGFRLVSAFPAYP